MKTIWRVAQYLFRYKLLYWLTILCAILSIGFALTIPEIAGYIVNGIEQGTISKLVVGVIVMIFCYLARELFNVCRIRVNNILEQKVLIDMRRDIHTKLLRLPASFYDKRKSGEIASRVVEDVANVERALLDGTEQGTTMLFQIVGILVILFWMQPFLAFFVVLPLPIILLISYRYGKRARRKWKRVAQSSANINALLIEDIQGNRLIQTFGLQEREAKRFATKARDLKKTTLSAMFDWSLYSPGSSFLSSMGTVAVFAVGGYMMLSSKTLNIGEFVAFFFYANMLYLPITRLTIFNQMLAAGKASGDRVFEILDAKEEVQSPKKPKLFPDGPLGVHFKDITFKYDQRQAVIQNFNLDIEAGKVTAIVGHTGAGKSTIANLVMRNYDITDGSLLINGTDIRELDLNAIHTHIGYVAQDPFLFDGSIRDNLILAKEDATDVELISALHGASAWDFVEKLPDQLNTHIGEKGIRLSQGEKQRLTIARVLLKNPPFVILDEATASVDTVTEKKIQIALEHLMSKRTVLVIAHRLSTVRKADKIIVLEKGQIVETGTHDKLLLEQGHYAKLWLHQVDVFQEE